MLNNFSFDSLKSLADLLNKECSLSIKKKSKAQLIADVETALEDPKVMAVYLIALHQTKIYSTDDLKKFIAVTTDGNKTLLSPVARYLEKINPPAPIKEVERKAITEPVIEHKQGLIPSSRLKTQFNPISVMSPTLQGQFGNLGFTDNNGDTIRGNTAKELLTYCWEHFPPNETVLAQGYLYPARIYFAAETKEIEINGKIQNRPIFEPIQNTRIEANQVVLQGYHTKTRRISLKPLATENIVAVDWIVNTITSLKGQNIKASRYRKNTVKSKISWGTGFCPVDVSTLTAQGYPLFLNGEKYTLVLNCNGSILLRGFGKLIATAVRGKTKNKWLGEQVQLKQEISPARETEIGKWNISNEEFCAEFLKDLSPEIYTVVNKCIEKVLENFSPRNLARLDGFFLGKYYSELARKERHNLTRSQYIRLRGNARKQIFKRYREGKELPLDVRQACYDLQEKQSSHSQEELNHLNDVLIGFYLSYIK